MRKILIISLLFVAFVSKGQDYRLVDWETDVSNVKQMGQDTFEIDVFPTDFNDPGAITLSVGNYFMDYVNRAFIVIASTSSTITVVDLEGKNTAPQVNQTGRIYASVNGQDTLFHSIGGVDLSTTDPASRWRTVARWNEEFARAIQTKQDSMPFQVLIMDTTYIPTGLEVKGEMSWDEDSRTYSVALGKGVVMQVNQESLAQIYNDTGDTLKDGRIVGFDKIINDLTAVRYASNYERHQFFGATTEDIPPDSTGMVVSLIGKIRGLNTGTLSLGAIYLDTLGYLTNTKPIFPIYTYPLGFVQKTGITDGVIQFRSDGVNFKNSINDAFDGAIRETFAFTIISDGVTTQGILNSAEVGSNSLTLVFSSGWYDFAVPDTIDLTSGTTTILEDNYIYIDEATRTLQTATSFTTLEHSKISISSLLDAASTQSNGALRNQNVNDHFKYTDDNGHILHMAERIRTLDSKWESGVAPTLSGTPSNLYFTTTGGKVWQLHLQDMPVQDMMTGDDIHVVNDFTTPYRTTTNLNDITAYSTGSAWNNQWSNLMLWGVVNKTGELSHIMVNLPSDGYQQEESAVADALNYTNYTIPRNFRGVGFLIGRFTIKRSGVNFTYNGGDAFLDLRGFVPNTTAGGGTGGGAAVTEWTQLNDIPASYIGFANAFATINALETGVEFTPRSDVLLTDLDSIGFKITIPQVEGLDSTLQANEINYGADRQVPLMNSAGDAFVYSSLFQFEGNKLTIPSLAVIGGSNFISMTQFNNSGLTPGASNGLIYMHPTSKTLIFKNSTTTYDLTDTGGGGSVTNVSSLTPNQLTVANGTTTPDLTIITGAVADLVTALATGDQIYDFVIGQDYKPNFTENTGFNKDFGAIAGTVAQGDDSRFHAPVDISGKWNNDGTSIATGNWDIGEFSFTSDGIISSALNPNIRLNSTKNGAWLVGEELASFDFFGNDVSGQGIGIKAKIAAVSINTFGDDFDLVFFNDNNGTLEESIRMLNAGGINLLKRTLIKNGSSYTPFRVARDNGGLETLLEITPSGSNVIWLHSVDGTEQSRVTYSLDNASFSDNVDAASFSVGGTSGATGTFTTVDSKTVTVTNGIIISIL